MGKNEESTDNLLAQSLKELLGHTPFEVFGGLILGIAVAYYQYSYIYNGVL